MLTHYPPVYVRPVQFRPVPSCGCAPARRSSRSSGNILFRSPNQINSYRVISSTSHMALRRADYTGKNRAISGGEVLGTSENRPSARKRDTFWKAPSLTFPSAIRLASQPFDKQVTMSGRLRTLPIPLRRGESLAPPRKEKTPGNRATWKQLGLLPVVLWLPNYGVTLFQEPFTAVFVFKVCDDEVKQGS
jgi:hypothetical protein